MNNLLMPRCENDSPTFSSPLSRSSRSTSGAIQPFGRALFVRGARSGFRGFTLIELLVVISILGVLMSLAVGGTGAIKEQARTAQAKNDCTGMAVAIKAFYTDYSRYPISAENASDLFMEPIQEATGNKAVMDVLTAAESVINPRGTVYFDAKAASNPEGNRPRGGIWNGGMFDPWGYTYGFAFDGDYDGKLVYPGGAMKDLSENARIIGGGAGVFSLGPKQKKPVYSW